MHVQNRVSSLPNRYTCQQTSSMLNRLTYLSVLLLLALVGYTYLMVSRDATQTGPLFVGAERCRPCHQTLVLGNQYDLWLSSRHAAAGETLFSEKGRALLVASGRPSQWCRACHTTTSQSSTTESAKLEGVGCERCHGPGSRYATFAVMASKARFHRSGGASGSLLDCYGCHKRDPVNDSSACPSQARPFNADSSWGIIAHPIPEDFAPRAFDQTMNRDE